jgi:hypothetical protein
MTGKHKTDWIFSRLQVSQKAIILEAVGVDDMLQFANNSFGSSTLFQNDKQLN